MEGKKSYFTVTVTSNVDELQEKAKELAEHIEAAQALIKEMSETELWVKVE